MQGEGPKINRLQCDKSLVIFHCTYVNLTRRMLIHATLASHMAAIGILISPVRRPHYNNFLCLLLTPVKLRLPNYLKARVE